MLSVETLNAMGTPYEIQPDVLAACRRFCPTAYSDIHKDARGFRPREGLGDRTAAQLDALMDRICKEAADEADYEAKREAEAVVAFDKLVDEHIGFGAGDYATAIRWMMDAADTDDIDYMLWQHGINEFKHTRRIRELAGMEA